MYDLHKHKSILFMKEKLEMLISDENENGVFAISIVSAPAMESDFITLNKEQEVKLRAFDEERRVLMGVAMIPNKLIHRNNFAGRDSVDIFFSEDTIRKTSELFLTKGNQSNTTFEHAFDLQGNTVVESWIKEDEVNDKSVKFGIDAPVGSWLVSMKINDDVAWELAKKGEVNGFSIEGLYDSAKLKKEDMAENENETVLSKLKAIILGEEKKEDSEKENQESKKDKETEKGDLSNMISKSDFESFATELFEVVAKGFEALNTKVSELEAKNIELKTQLDKVPDATHTNFNKTEEKAVVKTGVNRMNMALSQINKK